MDDTLIDLDQLVKADIPVKYRKKRYTLKPATEGVILKWRGLQQKNIRSVDGKITSDMSSLFESKSFLVSGCLYEGSDTVPHEEVKGWDGVAVDKLFDMAMEISDLKPKNEKKGSKEEDTEEGILKEIDRLNRKLISLRSNEDIAKNLSNGMTATSG